MRCLLLSVALFMSCQHVLTFFFLTYTGLTENLLQTEPADFDEVIEKLFGEVSALEDFPKITDPQVDLSV